MSDVAVVSRQLKQEKRSSSTKVGSEVRGQVLHHVLRRQHLRDGESDVMSPGGTVGLSADGEGR